MDRQESSDNSCNVCHEHISVWAVGPCDHPICYKCLTRMRILCNQLYCAICRSDLTQVLFVTNLRKFSDCEIKRFIPDWKNKIFFDTETTRQLYFKLLENACSLCPKRSPDRTFNGLRDHMRKEHGMFSCDLCVQHLQLFSQERKFYNRKDLATHRRTGDPDDKSYKGHPLCEFCDERYMDKDELHRHLRKDHYFCHFCDAHGTNEYYNDYTNLKEHFRADHYLCEEGECGTNRVQFTNAFRSDIDLKAHFAQDHSRNLSKAQIKEVRTLDIDIQMTRRRKPHERGVASGEDYAYSGSRGGRGGSQRQQQRVPRQSGRERENLQKALAESLKESLKNEERGMREVERVRRQAEQEEEVRRLKEDQMRRSVQNFPELSDSLPAGRLTPPQPQPPNPRTVPAKRSESAGVLSPADYPSLTSSAVTTNPNASRISNPRTVPPKRSESAGVLSPADYPSLTSSAVTTHPNASRISNSSKSVPVVSSIQNVSTKGYEPKRAETFQNFSAPLKRNTEDFPELGRPASASSSSSVGLMSLGVWSGKSQKKGQFRSSGREFKSTDYVENTKSKFKNVNVGVHNSLSHVSEMLCEDPYPQLAEPGASCTDWVKIPKSAKNKKNTNIKSGKSLKTVSNPSPCFMDNESPVNSSDETKVKNKKKKKKPKEQTDIDTVKKPTSENKPKVNGMTNSVEKIPVDKPEEQDSSDAVSSVKKIPPAVYKPTETDSGFSESSSGSLDGIAGGLLEKMKAHRSQVNEDLQAVDAVRKLPTGRPLNIQNKFDILQDEDTPSEPAFTTVKFTSKKQGKPFTPDDFPTLNPHTKALPFPKASTSCPPGFSQIKSAPLFKSAPLIKSAPPGFDSGSVSERSPPGFTLNTFLEETCLKPMPLLDYENFEYSKPSDFSERNKKLVDEVSNLLEHDLELFNQFKSYSGQFRKNSMLAAGYYESCRELLGEKKFSKIVSELISLLPDIKKQQELLLVHNKATKPASDTKVLNISGASKKAPWDSTVNKLLTCVTCHQVLVKKDYDEHMAQHTTQFSDFPTLTTSGPSSKFIGQSSLIRAK